MEREKERENGLGQPIGRAVEGWKGARHPERARIEGVRCWLEPLEADRHADALHAAYREDRKGANWTYLPYGPFESASSYRVWVAQQQSSPEDYFYAIVDSERETPIGVAAYLRVFAEVGSIEVGHLSYAPALQQTPTSTEAMYLMMRRVFDDWGYRRYEWKCDRLNAPSLAAAKRLGFRFEGVFRDHVVTKGRNRDTAWLSITRDEWPGIRDALVTWLEPDNFDADGRQRRRLGSLMPASAGQPIVRELRTA